MKPKLVSFLLSALLFSALTVSAFAQDKMIYSTADMLWADAPATLPPGTKIMVLEGDPSQEGPFTMRLKVPAGFKIAPHWHPGVEHVTVLSGTFYLAFGDKYDETKGTAMPVGSIAIMPPKHNHYAWAKEETIIQLHGMGPWKIYFVNPEDGPTK